ncbi:MAG: Crp/Fnr family transcriptional regulator [Paracoccaceae bacterium]
MTDRDNMQKHIKYLDEKAALFERIGWMTECSDPLRRWFSENGRWREVPKGKSLFRDGDETDGMYGVATGALDLEFAPQDVSDMVTLRMNPGGWVGHGSLVPNMPRPFNLRASVDSLLYYVPAHRLRGLLQERPEFWPEFYALTIRQILALMAFIGEAQSLLPETRLARQLLSLSATDGSIKLAQNDLAATLGISKSSLRRALKVLVDSGAIRTGYNRVDVLDAAALHEISQKTA